MIYLEAKISALKKMLQSETSDYNRQVLAEVIKDIKDEIKHNGMKGLEHSYKIIMDHKNYVKFINQK